MLYLKILLIEAVIIVVSGLIYKAMRNRRLVAMEQTYIEQWELNSKQIKIELCGIEKDENNERPVRDAIEYAKLSDNIEVRCYGKE